MRNLKRALSLALAAVMLVGMMVTGASAAGYNDFTDKDEIVNKDAVSLLTTLGVIDGKEDGSYFDPAGNVTRAEMAKMISVIMNKGTDVNSLYTDMNNGLTDIGASWAKGHINFCYSQNIIAGRGDGRFDPTANVTAVEAVKMLLVAAGYDPKIEGFEGPDWAANVNALASKLGLYDGYTKSVMDNLTRDDAALIIYNALDIEMIQKYEDGYAVAFSDSRTILSTMYGVYKVEGVVIQNQYAALDGTDYDDAASAGKTIMSDVVVYDSTTLNTTQGEGVAQKGNINFKVETPVEMLGKTVTMYVRKTTVLANSEVLGVFLNDGANTIKATNGNVSDLKDYLKGTGMSVDKDTEFYVNYGVQENQDKAEEALGISSYNRNGIEMEVIDNDGDGKADYVLYVIEDLTHITSLNEKKETITFGYDTEDELTSYNKGKAIDLDEVSLYDGAEDGDIVLVRTYGGHYYVSEPEVVNGKMESYSANKTNEQWIKVDGETYKPSFINTTAGGSVDDVTSFDVTLCSKTGGVQWDTTYDFFLDTNGYVAAFRPAEKSVTNYALVLNSGYNPGVYATDASGKVTALLADGTEGTYEINFSASAANLGKQIAKAKGVDYVKNDGIVELKGFMGTDYTDNSATRPWNIVYNGAGYTFANGDGAPNNHRAGQAEAYVITYTMSEDDVMTIKSVVGTFDNANTHLAADASDVQLTAEYKAGAASLSYTGGNKIAIDEDTVAFYWLSDDTYGVAVGYSKMAKVDANTEIMIQKNGTAKLAGVVLFNAEGVQAAKNYAYILGRNDHNDSGNYVELYSILEDGTAATLKVKRTNFDDMGLDADDDLYYTVFAYSTNGDGVTTLSEPAADTVLTGYGLKLKNGTVAYKATHTAGSPLSNTNYTDSYALNSSAKVWDVSDAEPETDASTGSFSTNKVKHAILVLDGSTKTKIVTAFVWNIDADESDDRHEDFDSRYNKDLNRVEIFNPGYATKDLAVINAITEALERAGFTDVDLTSGITLRSSTIATADVYVGKTKLTIPVVNVFKVTLDGKNPEYLANGEDYTFDGTNGDTYLVNQITAASADVTVAAGVGTYAVVMGNADSLNCFDIVPAYAVTLNGVTATYKDATNADQSFSSGNVLARGKVLTVTSTAGGKGLQLTATVGGTTTDFGSVTTEVGENAVADYTVNDVVSIGVREVPIMAESKADVAEVTAGTKFEGLESVVSTGVAATVDSDANEITLTSSAAITPLADPLSPQDQLALNIFWYGNDNLTGKPDMTVANLLTWYNAKHSASATKLAIVCISAGGDDLLLLVGNDATYDGTSHSFNGTNYTIDFSGLTW